MGGARVDVCRWPQHRAYKGQRPNFSSRVFQHSTQARAQRATTHLLREQGGAGRPKPAHNSAYIIDTSVASVRTTCSHSATGYTAVQVCAGVNGVNGFGGGGGVGAATANRDVIALISFSALRGTVFTRLRAHWSPSRVASGSRDLSELIKIGPLTDWATSLAPRHVSFPSLGLFAP
jgi:hypothetical protein